METTTQQISIAADNVRSDKLEACSRKWCRWTVFRNGKEIQCEGKPDKSGFCASHAYLASDFSS